MQIKHIFALFTLVLCPYSYAGNPWKLSLTDPKEKVTLTIDLHEESIEVPGMEMFGPMNGHPEAFQRPRKRNPRGRTDTNVRLHLHAETARFHRSKKSRGT